MVKSSVFTTAAAARELAERFPGEPVELFWDELEGHDLFLALFDAFVRALGFGVDFPLPDGCNWRRELGLPERDPLVVWDFDHFQLSLRLQLSDRGQVLLTHHPLDARRPPGPLAGTAMPDRGGETVSLHDWSRAPEEVVRPLGTAWLVALMGRLNRGGLPQEELIARCESYELPFRSPVPRIPEASMGPANGDLPRPSATIEAPRFRPLRAHRLVFFAREDARPVARLELVAPGGKSEALRARAYEAELLHALACGQHVLLLDPWPATPVAPGLGAAVAAELGAPDVLEARGHSVTSFERAPGSIRVYTSPLTPGAPLPEPLLFLAPGRCVPVPLGPTYAEAVAMLAASDRAKLV